MTGRIEQVAEAIRAATVREEDGEFQTLGDLLAHYGENKTRIFCEAAARAAIRVLGSDVVAGARDGGGQTG